MLLFITVPNELGKLILGKLPIFFVGWVQVF